MPFIATSILLILRQNHLFGPKLLIKSLLLSLDFVNGFLTQDTSGDNEMVQSILVGFDFDDQVLEYVQKRRLIEEKTVRLLKYRVNNAGNDIVLTEVEPK